jgi:hypothetical protein
VSHNEGVNKGSLHAPELPKIKAWPSSLGIWHDDDSFILENKYSVEKNKESFVMSCVVRKVKAKLKRTIVIKKKNKK